jgi:hypothetical protein
MGGGVCFAGEDNFTSRGPKTGAGQGREEQSTSDIDEALWDEAFVFTSLHFMTHDCMDGRLLK